MTRPRRRHNAPKYNRRLPSHRKRRARPHNRNIRPARCLRMRQRNRNGPQRHRRNRHSHNRTCNMATVTRRHSVRATIITTDLPPRRRTSSSSTSNSQSRRTQDRPIPYPQNVSSTMRRRCRTSSKCSRTSRVRSLKIKITHLKRSSPGHSRTNHSSQRISRRSSTPIISNRPIQPLQVLGRRSARGQARNSHTASDANPRSSHLTPLIQ